jgi:hypothetical protein
MFLNLFIIRSLKLDWINVASDAVKIGFGAIISGVTSYCILKKTHANELEKLKLEDLRKNTEFKKQNIIKFASVAHALTYQHIEKVASFESPEYIEFLNLYNSIVLISEDKLKVATSSLFDVVNNYIGINKEYSTESRDDLILKMRNDINIALGRFHKQAGLELNKT